VDINEMTIGQAKELAAMFAASQPAKVSGSSLIGQKVIVRAVSAGVHYGTLNAINGDTVTLSNARRLWSWQVADKKGISLSDVADHGASKASKICTVVPEHIVLGACEIMTTSAAAQASIEGADVHRP